MSRGIFTRSCIAMEASDILLKDMLRRAINGRAYSAQEIADYTGMSVEEVQAIEAAALEKLRSNARNACIITGLQEEFDGN